MGDGYREITARLVFPMVVVTVGVDGEPAGCLVGFHSASSIEPPRHTVYLSKANHTFRPALQADRLAVNFLGDDQHELASIFGELTEDHDAKFDQVAWQAHDGGPPVLDDVPAWFVGRVVARHDDGDHVAHVLEPVDAEVRRDWRPLTYQDVRDLDPGHDA